MASRYSPATSIPAATMFAVNFGLLTFGLLLLLWPLTVRQDIMAFQHRHFPIYPEGRPTAGSSKASYFPTHLNTEDNKAQIALGAAAAIYGCVSSGLLYLQWSRPAEYGKPTYKIAGWIAMIVAGAMTTVTAVIATGLSFEGYREGSSIDLNSVGYWPWMNMFPTIHWSIEGWTCKVHEQLHLPPGSEAAEDFRSMCEYSRASRWLSLSLLFLGISAMVMGCAAFAEQRCLEPGEKQDPRIEVFRDSEKSDKRLV